MVMMRVMVVIYDECSNGDSTDDGYYGGNGDSGDDETDDDDTDDYNCVYGK